MQSWIKSAGSIYISLQPYNISDIEKDDYSNTYHVLYVTYLTRRRTLVHGAYIGALHQSVPVTLGVTLFVADDFYVGLL